MFNVKVCVFVANCHTLSYIGYIQYYILIHVYWNNKHLDVWGQVHAKDGTLDCGNVVKHFFPARSQGFSFRNSTHKRQISV